MEVRQAEGWLGCESPGRERRRRLSGMTSRAAKPAIRIGRPAVQNVTVTDAE